MGEEGEEESGEDDNQDEDRSKIIHNMATKLLKFSKTINEVQKSNQGKTVRKKKKVLHNLVSRYRSLVTKILANWMKFKGKKKSGIPKQKGVAKRGEIMRGKGNHTPKATSEKAADAIAYQTATGGKKDTHPVSLPTASNKKSKKKTKKKDKIPLQEKETTKTVSDDEQDVLEIVHK
jgi:hypothetical protein